MKKRESMEDKRASAGIRLVFVLGGLAMMGYGFYALVGIESELDMLKLIFLGVVVMNMRMPTK